MVEIAVATVADAELVTAHRRAMFEAMGRGNPKSLDEMSRTFEPWVTPRLADERYKGWIARFEGRPVASAGFLVLEWPPVPHDPTNTARGYLLNIFVEPAFRRKGLARRLLDLCVAEGRRRGYGILALHASTEGRPLYEAAGFKASNEMQCFLDAK